MAKQSETPESRCDFGELAASRAYANSRLSPVEKDSTTAATAATTEPLIPVTFDNVCYKEKPSAYIGGITRRMQAGGSRLVTPAQFCEAVRRGRTFVCGCYEPNPRDWGKFLGQRLFAVDFDNKAGGVQLKEGDAGFLGMVEALERCYENGVPPLALYMTMSAKCPDVERYRIVFDYGEVVETEAEAREVYEKVLLELFPEADSQCKNPNRLFFGSNGEVIPLWDIERVEAGDE